MPSQCPVHDQHSVLFFSEMKIQSGAEQNLDHGSISHSSGAARSSTFVASAVVLPPSSTSRTPPWTVGSSGSRSAKLCRPSCRISNERLLGAVAGVRPSYFNLFETYSRNQLVVVK